MDLLVPRASSSLLLLLLLLPAFHGWALEFVVNGVAGEAKRNLEIFLNSRLRRLPENETAALRRVDPVGREALRAVGYYQPQFKLKHLGDEQWQLDVVAGPPVLVDSLRVEVTGEAATDPAFERYLRRLPLHTGDRLHHGQYETIKLNLQALAAQRGFFDGQLLKRQLDVDMATSSANIHIHFASGARYRFGAINIQGSHIDELQVQRLLQLQAGQPFDVSALSNANQRLARSQWFDLNRITTRRDEAQALDIPVDVELSPRLANNIETKLGWATDTGPRVGLAWNKPWINSAGHSLSTEIEWSEVKKTAEAAYRIPGDDPLDDYYEIAAGGEQVDNNDTDSRSYSLQVGRHSEWGDWLRSYTLRWLHEDFVQGDESGKVDLFLPGLSLQRLRVAGSPLDPYRMDKVLGTVEATDESIGSDIRLISWRGRLAGQWRPFDNHRFLARVDGGVLLTDDFEQVPYSMRFFAGGDQSVRGYGFESLAPTNSDGELIGGRNLLTVSGGYQYRVLPQWWAALFADAGGAFDSLDSDLVNRSIGMGVRWQSPFAMIRVDLAYPLDGEDRGLKLHFALGPEL